mgnify:CR=1 FL=1
MQFVFVWLRLIKDKILNKQETLEFKGKVTELLPNAMFRVKLENNHEKMIKYYPNKQSFYKYKKVQVLSMVLRVYLQKKESISSSCKLDDSSKICLMS